MTNEKVRGLDGNKFYMVASKRQPIWLAEIKGTDPKFGLKREFVPAPERGTINHEFTLEEDTYYAWNSEGTQEFGHFVNNQMEVMTKEEMVARVVAIENGTYKEEVVELETENEADELIVNNRKQNMINIIESIYKMWELEKNSQEGSFESILLLQEIREKYDLLANIAKSGFENADCYLGRAVTDYNYNNKTYYEEKDFYLDNLFDNNPFTSGFLGGF